MRKVYAVMEAVGNFSHTLEEFDNRDEASEFVMNRAMEDAKSQFKEGLAPSEIGEEFEEELELALSYYSIDEWKVA